MKKLLVNNELYSNRLYQYMAWNYIEVSVFVSFVKVFQFVSKCSKFVLALCFCDALSLIFISAIASEVKASVHRMEGKFSIKKL